MPTVGADAVLAFRLRANNLASRLAPGSHADAAYAGLQDSAPRAAQVALNARVCDAGPGAWEHPSLMQTWSPRGAAFVVAVRDLDVFALGLWPRDPVLVNQLQRLTVRARADRRRRPGHRR